MFNFLKNKSKYFVPSLSHFLFLANFLILLFSQGKSLLYDGDTGYHIRAGEYILDTFSIPRHDIFSFLTPPLPWTAHEWLSEVIMALIHRASGLTGIVIFFALLISIVYYLLLKVIQKERGNILFAILIVLWVLTSSKLHWLARPHIFSLLLLVVWYYLLDAFEYRQKNYLYLLPPIMLLWVNLHGGSFTSGFILIGIYFSGNFVRFIFSKGEERILYKKKTKLLGLTTAFCLLASLINPYSYRILLFPFKLVSDKFLMDHVMEFLPPNFHEFGVMFFKYLLLSMILVISISKRHLNIIEIVLIITFTNMALYAVRFIALFGIVVAPILARQLEQMPNPKKGRFKEFLQKRSTNIALIDASARGYVWPVAAVLIVVFFVATGRIEYRFNAEIHPVAAVDFLKKVHLKGNMFNNDEFGDYIIYSAYPQYKVFFDGRSDMYGSERMKEYYKVIRFESGWEKIIEKHSINWIIFDADSVLSRFLMERKDWRLIYADKVANIFVRNVPENQDLIDRYGNVKPVIVEKKD
jgi:hypothetical protein